MNKYPLLVFMSTFLFIFSCTNSEKSISKSIITERIIYDVIIKSPDTDLDWWVMNIEGAKREWLIKLILDKAYEGKIKAYDFLNNPLTTEEIKNIGKRNETLLMPSMEPPYEDSIVIINERLRINDITKIRFLEEWYIDENTLKIDKKVLGIAPVLEDFAPDGEIRGYKPLFWIYFDERYPLKD